MPRARSSSKNNSAANLGFEAKLWLAADKLRSNMDAALFNDSDTAPRGSALLQSRANPQVMREAQDNFRKDDDVRWQYGVPSRGNANFACSSLRNSAFALRTSPRLAPHGMAGFFVVRFWVLVKSKAARVVNGSGKATPECLRERRRETLAVERRELVSFGALDRLHSPS